MKLFFERIKHNGEETFWITNTSVKTNVFGTEFLEYISLNRKEIQRSPLAIFDNYTK